MIEIDPQAVKYGLDAFKAVLDAIKSLRDAIAGGVGRGAERQELDEQIASAERQLKLAEAQLAQSLQYRLCRAHFPPVAMLKDRVDARRVVEVHKCPTCGLEDPSPEYFAAEDRKDFEIQKARESRRARIGSF